MVAGSRFQLKNDEEIEIIRENCLLVSATIAEVATHLKPGIRGIDLDKIAESFIRDHGAEPAFKGYPGTIFDFPATLCISFNEVVVHGIPDNTMIKENDVVSIDCGVRKNNFFGDSAFTFAVGEISEEVMRLLVVTRESLQLGIDQAIAGNRIGDIGFAVQNHAETKSGYGVIREMVGHGLGRSLHEPPDVPNYGKRGKGMILQEGLVIAIEPMINLGSREVVMRKDGWTLFARDQKQSAHYEHTIVVRKAAAEVLSDHSGIDQAIKNNPDLSEVWIKK
ncbi:MAG TPA: type I methionyl aminopeptidase [Saprospiraceae bacterium]|nr:type I methionyl aminopeptidase [Saprospiraceae bacterium]